MARQKASISAYRRHAGSGQAVAYIDRREVYLGVHGSPESRQKYAELISRLTGGESALSVVATDKPTGQKSVAAVCMRYIAERLPAYARDEQHCQRGAIKVLSELFGQTPASDFGPLRLRAVRNAMISGDADAKDANGNTSITRFGICGDSSDGGGCLSKSYRPCNSRSKRGVR